MRSNQQAYLANPVSADFKSYFTLLTGEFKTFEIRFLIWEKTTHLSQSKLTYSMVLVQIPVL